MNWLTDPWWSYNSSTGTLFPAIYHWFNICEACIWLICAGIVLARYIRNRHSPLELLYAAAFISFAITDFREAFQVGFTLVIVKLLNLALLLYLRSLVLKRFYPTHKII
jgi:hypothetical protein